METLLIALGVMLFCGALFFGFSRYKPQNLVVGSKVVVPPEGLEFVSTNGKPLFKIDANQYGGGIFIYDHNAKPMGSMYMNGECAMVRLFNKQGQVIWLSPQK